MDNAGKRGRMLRVARSKPYRSYAVKYRSRDRTLSEGGYLFFPKEGTLGVGDLVNLPEGRPPYRGYYARATKGHIWRIVGVEEPNLLVVEYVRKLQD